MLTIAIPTYNRARNVAALLDHFLSLPTAYLESGHIALFVSDNSSSDDTGDVIAKHQLSRFVRYVRQSRNIGAAANIMYLLANSDTDYVLAIGDDDRPDIANLTRFVAWIEQHPLAFCVIPFLDTANTRREPETPEVKRFVRSKGFIGTIDFLGSLVLSREAACAAAADGELVSSNLPMVEVFLRVQKQTPAMVFMGSPIVRAIGNSSRWTVEDWLAITSIELLELIDSYAKRGWLDGDEHRRFLQANIPPAIHTLLISIVVGKSPERSQLVARAMLSRYRQDLPRSGRWLATLIERTPTGLLSCFQPALFLVIYRLIYRGLVIRTGNLFRSLEREDGIEVFRRTAPEHCSWRFDWDRLARSCEGSN